MYNVYLEPCEAMMDGIIRMFPNEYATIDNKKILTEGSKPNGQKSYSNVKSLCPEPPACRNHSKTLVHHQHLIQPTTIMEKT